MDPLDRELNTNQEILTTDQLYKLVRGEVPEVEQKQSWNKEQQRKEVSDPSMET